jgi:hypothetical protein
MKLRLIAPIAIAIAALAVLGGGTARADVAGCYAWAEQPFTEGQSITSRGGFSCGSYQWYKVTVCLEQYDRALEYWGRLACGTDPADTDWGWNVQGAVALHVSCSYGGYALYRTWTQVHYLESGEYQWVTSDVAYNCRGY